MTKKSFLCSVRYLCYTIVKDRFSLARGMTAYGSHPKRQPFISNSVSAVMILIKNTIQSGGDNRDRTGNLLRAKQALSQLSYIPIDSICSRPRQPSANVVGPPGFEPGTSALSARRSSQLSYRPIRQHRRQRKDSMLVTRADCAECLPGLRHLVCVICGNKIE